MVKFTAAIVALCLYLSSYGEALAYLDLGSGSYLIQFLFAGLFGALFYIKLAWGRIKLFFTQGRQSLTKDQSDTMSDAGPDKG